MLCDPITLAPTYYAIDKYIKAYFGRRSLKNNAELLYFKEKFKLDLSKSYMKNIHIISQNVPDGSTILDVGCGPNDGLRDFVGEKFFLDDLIDFYIDQLHAVYSGTPVHAKSEAMPFSDNTFDFIYSINMIDHVDDMPESIAEMHRVLKNDGTIYMQSYYNSHPLLPTEPGVFDAFFYNNYVKEYFNILEVSTYALGDPRVSSSYTMDIITLTLKKKNVNIQRKDRNLYKDADYIGPQSCISNAIISLQSGEINLAESYLKQIANEPFYKLHFDLLTLWIHILKFDFGKANFLFKQMKSDPRIRKNTFARFALLELENKRIIQAGNLSK